MASQQEIELRLEGVLEKAGKRFFEGYRKRWFYLEGKKLTYYKAPERTNENLLGMIDLSRVKSVNPVKMISNGFQIVTGNRTYHLSAPTPELMTDWVSVLRQAMQLQSFSRHRTGKKSSRTERDEAGYDVINRQSRSSSNLSDASQPSFDEDDILYEPVEELRAIAEQNTEMGSYSVVGSKTTEQKAPLGRDTGGAQPASNTDGPLGTYEDVGSIKLDNVPAHDLKGADMGSYGLVGDSAVVMNNEPVLYDTIADLGPYRDDKARLMANNHTASETVNGDENGPTVQPLLHRDPNSLSLICESDSEEETDNSSVTMETEVATENPLPPPVGDTYAADQIKIWLQEEIARDREGIDPMPLVSKPKDECEFSVIPASCESAFTKLKMFLSQLEEAPGIE